MRKFLLTLVSLPALLPYMTVALLPVFLSGMVMTQAMKSSEGNPGGGAFGLVILAWLGIPFIAVPCLLVGLIVEAKLERKVAEPTPASAVAGFFLWLILLVCSYPTVMIYAPLLGPTREARLAALPEQLARIPVEIVFRLRQIIPKGQFQQTIIDLVNFAHCLLTALNKCLHSNDSHRKSTEKFGAFTVHSQQRI